MLIENYSFILIIVSDLSMIVLMIDLAMMLIVLIDIDILLMMNDLVMILKVILMMNDFNLTRCERGSLCNLSPCSRGLFTCIREVAHFCCHQNYDDDDGVNADDDIRSRSPAKYQAAHHRCDCDDDNRDVNADDDTKRFA